MSTCNASGPYGARCLLREHSARTKHGIQKNGIRLKWHNKNGESTDLWFYNVNTKKMGPTIMSVGGSPQTFRTKVAPVHVSITLKDTSQVKQTNKQMNIMQALREKAIRLRAEADEIDRAVNIISEIYSSI